MKRDHLTVILEEMNGKFSAVLEAVTGHERRLDRKLAELRDELVERIDIVEVKLSATDSKLTTRIDEFETKLGGRLDAVAADLKAHRADTEAHLAGYNVAEKAAGHGRGGGR